MWTDCNCGRRNALGDSCPHCGDGPEAAEDASERRFLAAVAMYNQQYGTGPMDPLGLELALQARARGEI